MITFPDTVSQAARIIPSITPIPEYRKGSREWLQEELEKQFQKVAGRSGIIIIPPKQP